MVVYHLHGKPIRFEIVVMVSKISDRKSHSDYALPFRVTDWKALKYLIIPIVKSRRAWNW
jgi:hypothetical protein